MWIKIFACGALTLFLLLAGCSKGNIKEGGVDPAGDQDTAQDNRLMSDDAMTNTEASEEIGIDDRPITDEDIVVDDTPKPTGNEM